jgi:hypothetical protein
VFQIGPGIHRSENAVRLALNAATAAIRSTIGNLVASPFRSAGRALTLRQLLPDFGDIFMRRRPVRIACIAMENQRAGFQLGLEIFPVERNRLIVVVRTNNFKIQAVAHAGTLLIARLAERSTRSAFSQS